MIVSSLLAVARRVALWSVALASALTFTFAAAGGFAGISLAWSAATVGAFAVALLPAVTALAAVGAWRARGGALAVRGRAMDGWLIAGFLVWLFFVRLEPAHQLVGPTRHLTLLGVGNLVLLALAGVTIVHSWERAGDTGRTRALATTGVTAALLMAIALYQDPAVDRSPDAEHFVASTKLGAPPPAAPARVLFLGVDALDWRLLQAVSDVESLPVMRGLINEGRRWALNPVGLKRSPEIWATIHTARPPDAHGIWGFADWVLWNGRSTLSARPYFGPHVPLFIDHVLARLPARIAEPRLATADGLRVPTFWEVASAGGTRSVVVSPFPFTSPLVAIEGVMAVRDAQERQWFISSTTDSVTSEMSVPESDVATEPPLDDEDGDLRAMHDQRVALSVTLFRTANPRLGVFYTSYLDEILHRHWRDGCPAWGGCTLRIAEERAAVVRQAFRQLDEDLGRLINAFGPGATVVLVSDHGWELGEGEHVSGPDGVLVLSPASEPGFGGRADIYEVAPSMLDLLGLPVEAAMGNRNVFDREVPSRALRTIESKRLRRAARPSADRLSLLKSVGYIAR